MLVRSFYIKPTSQDTNEALSRSKIWIIIIIIELRKSRTLPFFTILLEMHLRKKKRKDGIQSAKKGGIYYKLD